VSFWIELERGKGGVEEVGLFLDDELIGKSCEGGGEGVFETREGGDGVFER